MRSSSDPGIKRHSCSSPVPDQTLDFEYQKAESTAWSMTWCKQLFLPINVVIGVTGVRVYGEAAAASS